MKKVKVFPKFVFGDTAFGIKLDHRNTEIGRQNWDVCGRMLIHDLLDLAESTPALKRVLDFYQIGYTENGGYTMALPRLMLVEKAGMKIQGRTHGKSKK